jgi:hypothetical protein
MRKSPDRFLRLGRWLSIAAACLVFSAVAGLLHLTCHAPPQSAWMQRAHTALAPSRRRTFSEIYGQDKWNVGAMPDARDAVTRAGPGSSLLYTAAVREFLGAFIRNHSISTVADLSCNEMLWQPLIPGFAELHSFAGFDIVPAAIAVARANMSYLAAQGVALPAVTLEVMDMTSETLPRAYDLVIVRDTFFHLPITDTLAALTHIASSGSRFLGTTTIDLDKLRNAFIFPGEWYPLNLRKPPFFFPPPIAEVLEGLPGTDYWGTKKFSVWRLPLELGGADGGH